MSEIKLGLTWMELNTSNLMPLHFKGLTVLGVTDRKELLIRQR